MIYISYHIIRTAYYIHGPGLMKLIFAVLCIGYVSQRMSLTRCYKTRVFLHLLIVDHGYDSIDCTLLIFLNCRKKDRILKLYYLAWTSYNYSYILRLLVSLGSKM